MNCEGPQSIRLTPGPEGTRWARVTWLLWLPVLAVLIGEAEQDVRAAERGEEEPDRWNVVLITLDDLSQDSVGAYGCPVDQITPHIDSLAGEGIRFVHAHVTIAVCQPCRAVWLTGRYPHRNGAIGFQPIDAGVPTLPEALRKAGYQTAILGKLNHCLPSRPQDWEYSVGVGALGQGRDPELYYHHAREILDRSVANSQPVFLMANTHDPHRPFAGSRQEAARLERQEEPGRHPPPISRIYGPDEVVVPGFLPDLPPIREEIAQYFTSVHRGDESVGAVLRAIDDAGLRDSTIVILMSDHGMALPFAKTNCYFHSTRTPWIVRWPGRVEAGQVDEIHMISGIDLTPTILEMLTLPPLDGLDGRSLVPILDGEQQEGRDAVMTQFHRTSGRRDYPMRSLVTRDFGYIFNAWHDGQVVFRNESQSGLTMNAMIEAGRSDPAIQGRVDLFLTRTPEELYQYRNDPDALHNLVDVPEHRDTLAELRRRLLQMMIDCEDPLAPVLQAVIESSDQPLPDSSDLPNASGISTSVGLKDKH